MKFNIEINSGAAFLMTFSAGIIAIILKANMVCFAFLLILYVWHSGRRLVKQIKCGPLEITNKNGNGQYPVGLSDPAITSPKV